MRIKDYAEKIENWDYSKSEHVITAVAFLCDEPSWEREENGVLMGLYVIGRNKVWLEKAIVEARKKQPFECEASIDEVAGLMANKLIIDEETNEIKFRYVLDDGRIAEYSSSDILKKRAEQTARKFNNFERKQGECFEHEV